MREISQGILEGSPIEPCANRVSPVGPGNAVGENQAAHKIGVKLVAAETSIIDGAAVELHGREHHPMSACNAELCGPVGSVHAGRYVVVVDAVQAYVQMV